VRLSAAIIGKGRLESVILFRVRKYQIFALIFSKIMAAESLKFAKIWNLHQMERLFP